MDHARLQATLRHFAAERDWQAFHSPKNLSTALMVEAAELAEIFQWMTPEQSRQAHDQPDVKARIGEELADVLLYLLQVADHTKVDLAQAAQHKLVRNAEKYPPVRAIEAVASAASWPGETHVLLDYENVQPSEAELRALVPGVSDVWVFHGPHQKMVDARFTSFGTGVTLIPISKTGKNALDFHLSYYMGYITSRNPNARFVVVANDKGYDSMLEHAKELGFAVEKRGHQRLGAESPRAVVSKKVSPGPTVPKAAAKKKPAKRPVAAKTVATRKTAAKKMAPVTAKVNPPAKKAGNRSAPTKKAVKAVAPGSPAMLAKIVASLRKMGVARPAKAAALRRTVKTHLGKSASDDAVTESINNLVAKGAIAVSPTGDITYRL